MAANAGTDAWEFSFQDRALHFALQIIKRSTRFPPAARAWVSALHSMPVDPDAQFKDWWEHNKEAVLAKQYEKATWIPDEKIGKDPPDTPAQAPAKITKPSAPSKPAPLAPPDSSSPLPWLLAALAVLAAGAAALKLRRK